MSRPTSLLSFTAFCLLIGLCVSKGIYLLDPYQPNQRAPFSPSVAIRCPNDKLMLQHVQSQEIYITDGTQLGTFQSNFSAELIWNTRARFIGAAAYNDAGFIHEGYVYFVAKPPGGPSSFYRSQCSSASDIDWANVDELLVIAYDANAVRAISLSPTNPYNVTLAGATAVVSASFCRGRYYVATTGSAWGLFMIRLGIAVENLASSYTGVLDSVTSDMLESDTACLISHNDMFYTFNATAAGSARWIEHTWPGTPPTNALLIARLRPTLFLAFCYRPSMKRFGFASPGKFEAVVIEDNIPVMSFTSAVLGPYSQCRYPQTVSGADTTVITLCDMSSFSGDTRSIRMAASAGTEGISISQGAPISHNLVAGATNGYLMNRKPFDRINNYVVSGIAPTTFQFVNTTRITSPALLVPEPFGAKSAGKVLISDATDASDGFVASPRLVSTTELEPPLLFDRKPLSTFGSAARFSTNTFTFPSGAKPGYVDGLTTIVSDFTQFFKQDAPDMTYRYIRGWDRASVVPFQSHYLESNLEVLAVYPSGQGVNLIITDVVSVDAKCGRSDNRCYRYLFVNDAGLQLRSFVGGFCSDTEPAPTMRAKFYADVCDTGFLLKYRVASANCRIEFVPFSSVTTANNITVSTTINPEKLVCAKGSTNKFFTILQTGSNPTTVIASIIQSPSTSPGSTSALGHLGGIGNTTFFKTGVTQVKPFNAQTGAFGTAITVPQFGIEFIDSSTLPSTPFYTSISTTNAVYYGQKCNSAGGMVGLGRLISVSGAMTGQSVFCPATSTEDISFVTPHTQNAVRDGVVFIFQNYVHLVRDTDAPSAVVKLFALHESKANVTSLAAIDDQVVVSYKAPSQYIQVQSIATGESKLYVFPRRSFERLVFRSDGSKLILFLHPGSTISSTMSAISTPNNVPVFVLDTPRGAFLAAFGDFQGSVPAAYLSSEQLPTLLLQYYSASITLSSGSYITPTAVKVNGTMALIPGAVVTIPAGSKVEVSNDVNVPANSRLAISTGFETGISSGSMSAGGTLAIYLGGSGTSNGGHKKRNYDDPIIIADKVDFSGALDVDISEEVKNDIQESGSLNITIATFSESTTNTFSSVTLVTNVTQDPANPCASLEMEARQTPTSLVLLFVANEDPCDRNPTAAGPDGSLPPDNTLPQWAIAVIAVGAVLIVLSALAIIIFTNKTVRDKIRPYRNT